MTTLKKQTSKQAKPPQTAAEDPLRRLQPEQLKKKRKGCEHVFGKGYRCDTDTLGYATPDNKNPIELVLDASEGFIPLWQQGITLRWRFQENALLQFADVPAAKAALRDLMSEALLLWGDAAPVKFSERDDLWDFEVVVRENDNCNVNGCVLASAFFPDPGRHELVLYPKTFTEPRQEQIETLAHEFGHIFGLRHFFAQISEKQWPSVIFGKHKPFSIMNYGEKSVMTDDDRSDLKNLYRMVWSGELTDINGTPIKLVKPYHMM